MEKIALQLFTAIFLLAFLAGCVQVQAWERGTLAKAEMSWDPDPLATQLRDHIYFSKEGSTGSVSLGGGGCGCN